MWTSLRRERRPGIRSSEVLSARSCCRPLAPARTDPSAGACTHGCKSWRSWIMFLASASWLSCVTAVSLGNALCLLWKRRGVILSESKDVIFQWHCCAVDAHRIACQDPLDWMEMSNVLLWPNTDMSKLIWLLNNCMWDNSNQRGTHDKNLVRPKIVLVKKWGGFVWF